MTSRSVDDFARKLAPKHRSVARASSIDHLARTMAAPMPRRRALRLLGSALVVAAVPALRPSSAGATGSGVEQRPDIIDPPDGPWGSPVQCGRILCSPVSNCVKCCPAEGGGGSCCPCYFTCRPRSGLCDKPITGCAPDGRPFCGGQGKCCLLNETCWRGSVCLPICKPNEQLCGDDCCPPSTECLNLQLPGSRGRLTCWPKCPSGRTRCGINCCPRGQKCIDARAGKCSPCDVGQRPCGRKCCQRGSTCCDPRTGLCCKSNETCAGYGGTAKCCPRGTKACEESPGRIVCCDRGEVCAQQADGSGSVPAANRRRYTCCPRDRQVSFSGTFFACCPRGYKSLGGRFIVPPGGGGGMCCRNDKLCGNTCCGTNSDPGINQTCCNDRCVSLYFDPQNCGRCGASCPPGNRCQAGRCVPA